MHRILLLPLALFLLAPSLASAVDVDPFTAAQGPISVGPGEEPTEEEAILLTPSVVGGFRVVAPVVDENAPAGSIATATIGGGEFECELDFAVNNSEFGGGCGVGWGPEEPEILDPFSDETGNMVFDVSNTGAFEFDVLEAAPGVAILMTLVDVNDNPTSFVIEEPSPGSYTLPIAQFFSLPFTDPVDLTAIEVIVLAAGYIDGAEGTVRIGPVSSTGPITTRSGPGGSGDDVTVDQVFGTYFDTGRDGEGCQLTAEGATDILVISCYVYLNGEQVWIVGSGSFDDEEATFENVQIAEGADFGDAFDPADVTKPTWGTIVMDWDDCNEATLTFIPGFEAITRGYLQFEVDYEKIVQSDCSSSIAPNPAILQFQGTLWNSSRDGEGIHLAAQGDTGIFAVSWYTFLDGRQVFLVGAAALQGNTLTFDNLEITSGADWGSDFDAGDVIKTLWGTLIIVFSDCNTATLSATPAAGQVQAGFSDYEGPLTKLLPGTCVTP